MVNFIRRRFRWVFGAFALVVGLSVTVFGVDRKLSDYVTHGAFDYHVVQTAIDSNSALSSQIRLRPIHVPITSGATAADTVYNYVMTVPVGMTVTINAATISAHVPPLGKAGSDSILLFMYFYDASAATMAKYATTQRLSDSALVTTLPGILVADSTEVVTIDSVTTFAAGDILYIATYTDTAAGGAPGGLGMTFDMDIDD